MKFILASASPRRQELLKTLGLSFEICPSNIEEKINKNASFSQVCTSLADAKAGDVLKKYSGIDEAAVLGADTIVVLNNEILGKPKNKDDAFRMLSALSGRNHFVYTGCALFVKRGDEVITKTFSDKTEVFMSEMTDNEIRDYISTGEPMDKAGAYGIQGIGARFIEKINGNYQTVVGLNTCLLYKALKELNVI
ncbi:MAG: Maf family protein [Clostridiales bacterium]|nr:Maf family protein [Clostridiales bacterium]